MISQRAFIMSLLLAGLLLAGCGGSATVPATVIRLTATRSPATNAPVPPATTSRSPAQTPAPAATPTSAPAATSTSAGETITLEFTSTLSTVEEMDHIRDLLQDTEGILAITGTEVSITITYDPNILTVEDLRGKLEEIGYPVKPLESAPA